jgi:hypothetical protein
LTNSFADAVDWCCVRLQEAGVSLNPEIERLRVDARRLTPSGTEPA